VEKNYYPLYIFHQLKKLIFFFWVKHLTKLSTHIKEECFKEENICHVAAREWISTLPQLSSLATYYSQKPEVPPNTLAQRFETSLKLHFRSQSLWRLWPHHKREDHRRSHPYSSKRLFFFFFFFFTIATIPITSFFLVSNPFVSFTIFVVYLSLKSLEFIAKSCEFRS
jgi:hypothetical protein